MYARVSQVRIRPEQVPEATRIYREQVVPALKRQPGFAHAALLVQPDSGRGISITIWESEAARTGGEVSGFYREQLERFAGMFVESPVREVFEVPVYI
jgi:heme-degrading monooxygenase HmoA